MEVRYIVQEAVSKAIPKEKKSKRAKWLSEGAFQTTEERSEAKGKGEGQTYTRLNAEFQRIPRRDKRGFLKEQCKEIEVNNRMGQIRDCFRKTGDIQGIFHARMGMIKDRNSKDPTKAEKI